MSYTTGPIKLKNEEGLKFILLSMLKANKDVKIVEDNKDLEYLIKQTMFLKVCEKLKSQNMPVYVMTEQSEIIPQLQKFVYVYISPKQPIYHFVNIDRIMLFIQKKHKINAPSRKKDWLCTHYDLLDGEKYNGYFNSWAKKCKKLF